MGRFISRDIRRLALLTTLLCLASCTPLPDWGASPPKRESASPAKYSYKYIFNEPSLAGGKENRTQCGLTETDFKAYVEGRILPEWEIVEIRYFERNFQTGKPCVGHAVIIYKLKKEDEQ